MKLTILLFVILSVTGTAQNLITFKNSFGEVLGYYQTNPDNTVDVYSTKKERIYHVRFDGEYLFRTDNNGSTQKIKAVDNYGRTISPFTFKPNYDNHEIQSRVYGNTKSQGYIPQDVKYQSALDIPVFDYKALGSVNSSTKDFVNSEIEYFTSFNSRLEKAYSDNKLRKTIAMTIQDETLRAKELNEIELERQKIQSRFTQEYENHKRLVSGYK